jgi:hypothetical protein
MMSLDWKSGSLAEGLACYRGRRFFDAHEHWESVWLRLEEPEKSFLQALIQMTAAFHHLNSGNSTGALSLLRRTRRRLEGRPERFGGIDVASLRLEVGEWIRALEEGDCVRPEAFPRIAVE